MNEEVFCAVVGWNSLCGPWLVLGLWIRVASSSRTWPLCSIVFFFYSFDCSAHILLKYGKISNIKNIRETWRDSMFTARNTKNWIYFCAHGSDNCVTFVQKGWDVSWDSDNLLSQHKFNYWRANSLVLLLTMFWMPADNKSITIPLKLFFKNTGTSLLFRLSWLISPSFSSGWQWMWLYDYFAWKPCVLFSLLFSLRVIYCHELYMKDISLGYLWVQDQDNCLISCRLRFCLCED